MKVRIFPSAIADLQDILEWYSTQSVAEVGQRLVAEIIEKVETLAQHAVLGRVVPEYSNTNIRELIHPLFRVVYLKEDSMIAVVRVWRSERLLHL